MYNYRELILELSPVQDGFVNSIAEIKVSYNGISVNGFNVCPTSWQDVEFLISEVTSRYNFLFI